MSSASRGARAAARPIRSYARSQSRRYASHGDSHGHNAEGSAYHADSGAASGSDGFGRGFYIAVAAIPAFYLSYQFATGEKNFVQRFVDGYASVKDTSEVKKSTIHDAAVQQAINDRFLLKGTAANVTGPPTRYQEQFNVGSPMNVVAGEGTTDLSALVKHYEEEERKRQEAREKS